MAGSGPQNKRIKMVMEKVEDELEKGRRWSWRRLKLGLRKVEDGLEVG